MVTEYEILQRLDLYPMPEDEERLWRMTTEMNTLGVRVDAALIEGALTIHAQSAQELTDEAVRITGLANPNSTMQLKAWLEEMLSDWRETDVQLEGLRKEDVSNLLEIEDLPAEVRRVLEIRQQLGKTSIKKYVTIHAAKGRDDRVRGLTQYYGANRTGRWAGRLVQMQNLPRNYLKTLDYARELVKKKNYDGVRMLYGNVPDTLSSSSGPRLSRRKGISSSWRISPPSRPGSLPGWPGSSGSMMCSRHTERSMRLQHRRCSMCRSRRS